MVKRISSAYDEKTYAEIYAVYRRSNLSWDIFLYESVMAFDREIKKNKEENKWVT